MKKNGKKILALILCLVMALGVLSMTASATDYPTSGKCGYNLTWRLDTYYGELTIDGVGKMDDCGYIGENAPWKDYIRYIKTVKIGYGVTSIGRTAFYNCQNMTSVSIPKSVSEIDRGAFWYCKNLASISIPASVSKIDGNVFKGCSELRRIDVESSNPYYVSVDGVLVRQEWPKELVAYPPARSATEYTIPLLGGNDVNYIDIGDYAFYECNKLEKVIIPEDSVLDIKDCAFSSCKGLTEVIIRSCVYIGDLAFAGCSSLRKITIPDSLDYIGFYAFKDCGLQDVYYGGNRVGRIWIRREVGNLSVKNAKWHFNSDNAGGKEDYPVFTRISLYINNLKDYSLKSIEYSSLLVALFAPLFR